MNILVYTIYYDSLIIKIYWNGSNVLVHHFGMCLILPDMPIMNVLCSLGFYNRNIVSMTNDLEMYVSSKQTGSIHITDIPPKPSCIQSILKKFDFLT